MRRETPPQPDYDDALPAPLAKASRLLAAEQDEPAEIILRGYPKILAADFFSATRKEAVQSHRLFFASRSRGLVREPSIIAKPRPPRQERDR